MPYGTPRDTNNGVCSIRAHHIPHWWLNTTLRAEASEVRNSRLLRLHGNIFRRALPEHRYPSPISFFTARLHHDGSQKSMRLWRHIGA